MINIRLSSNASQHGKAEIHIDYHNVNILFTVVEGVRGVDFSLNLQEWELLKKFIELQIETKTNLNNDIQEPNIKPTNHNHC